MFDSGCISMNMVVIVVCGCDILRCIVMFIVSSVVSIVFVRCSQISLLVVVQLCVVLLSGLSYGFYCVGLMEDCLIVGCGFMKRGGWCGVVVCLNGLFDW